MELPVTCGFFLPGFESIHFFFEKIPNVGTDLRPNSKCGYGGGFLPFGLHQTTSLRMAPPKHHILIVALAVIILTN